MNQNPAPLERARDYEREQSTRISAHERPLFHLTPPVGWMNDPNGFCWYKGQYHLFYQYHPYSTSWGPMHWGHAVSKDLLRWIYEPCALAPDTEADAGGCFSGSAVPLPDGRLMLVYTGVQIAGTFRRETQAQCVAIGDGVDFEKSRLNPVLHQAHLPEGYSAFDFRDPKAWLGEDGTYYLVVGNRHAQRMGTVLLFSSADGLNWQFEGEIDSSREEYGHMWECPDFFPLDGKQVLIVSPQQMHAREEFHAGYGTVALLGAWDEAHCQFERETVQPVDHGLNFYAPQTVLSPDGRRIMIGWMDNWETCKGAPRRHAWYAQMSVPRELRIEKGRLMQRPVREIESLWQDTVSYSLITVQEETELPGVRGRLMDMTVILHAEACVCRRFTLRVAKDAQHFVQIRCDLARGELVFDRSHGGSRRDIVHTRHVKAQERDGQLSLRLLMDKESIELFINEGERVVTSLIPTPLDADGITFAADAPLRLSVEAHHLGA
ncbi:MAG: glycoside hydrolase family 32 protein [Clostridia bacterium]|nr:glycoside hydrolase family 32 protein [Clostridia bacterium]